MSTEGRYDAVIVGSGQGGGPLAGTLAKNGWKVALVEKEHVGGSCVNVGCTPTKALVASARTAWLARRAAEYGLRTGGVETRMSEVKARKDKVVTSFRQGSEKGLDKAGVELVRGRARFTARRRLEVELAAAGSRTLEGEKIFLNTGARPVVPEIDGLDAVPFLDSTSIMELDELPEHLLVLGGGYIGLEFGQMFRRFGSRVTILQRAPQLLAREDEEVAAAVAAILEEDGIEVLLETETQRVSRGEDGGLRLEVAGPEGERVLTGSHLLVAAGRRPNSDDLGLEAAGVETDERGHVKVDERLETSAEGVYALGDVKPGPAFTHISYDDFRILRENLLGDGGATTDGRFVPYTVYIDPQLGRVGLSEREAKKNGVEYRLAEMPMSRVARAIEMGETRGLVKVLVAADSDRILGAAVLGVEGGEIMSMLQIAMMGDLPYPKLRNGIFAHPTLAESLNNLFGKVE